MEPPQEAHRGATNTAVPVTGVRAAGRPCYRRNRPEPSYRRETDLAGRGQLSLFGAARAAEGARCDVSPHVERTGEKARKKAEETELGSPNPQGRVEPRFSRERGPGEGKGGGQLNPGCTGESRPDFL